MTRSVLKKDAKDQLSKSIGPLILCNVIFDILVVMPFIANYFINAPYEFNFSTTEKSFGAILSSAWQQIMSNVPLRNLLFLDLFTLVSTTLLTPPLILGLQSVYLKVANGEKVHFTDMFKKTNQFGRSLLMNLLIGIFTILQFLLLIVPGIIATYSYSMAYFVLADHPEFTAMEAITESKKIMKGHKFELFVLQLSFFWWYLLIILTLGLASIYVVPYIEMATANFYNKIKNA